MVSRQKPVITKHVTGAKYDLPVFSLEGLLEGTSNGSRDGLPSFPLGTALGQGCDKSRNRTPHFFIKNCIKTRM
jgi:hypothetical protein